MNYRIKYYVKDWALDEGRTAGFATPRDGSLGYRVQYTVPGTIYTIYTSAGVPYSYTKVQYFCIFIYFFSVLYRTVRYGTVPYILEI